MSDPVYLREVGLRDGLQLVGTVLGTREKLTWIESEVAAGVREIEVTSFVPPKSFPQFADAEAVAVQAAKLHGLTASALAVNARGAVRALDAGLRSLNYVISASDAHSLANARTSVEGALEGFRSIVQTCTERGVRADVHLTSAIATAFGCTLQGDVRAARVLEIAERLLEAGADEIMLADTVGYAHPAQVKGLFLALSRLTDGPLSAHFHDTRGLALANVAAALDVGVRRFDASLGGLGGCPFAPGATGNVCTVDCAFLLESMGFDTGIDIERLIETRRKVQSWLPGESLSGAIARAGLPMNFRRAVEA